MIEKEMKNLAWNTFKQTGNIETFMELKQLQNLHNNKIKTNLNELQDEQYFSNDTNNIVRTKRNTIWE